MVAKEGMGWDRRSWSGKEGNGVAKEGMGWERREWSGRGGHGEAKEGMGGKEGNGVAKKGMGWQRTKLSAHLILKTMQKHLKLALFGILVDIYIYMRTVKVKDAY